MSFSLRLLAVLLTCSGICSGQTVIDSLKNALAGGKNHAHTLATIGFKYQELQKHDSAIIYFHQSVAQPENANNLPLLASTLSNLGTSLSKIGFQDSALYYYEKSLRLYKEDNNAEKASWVETNMGIIYKDEGLYDKALEYTFSAIDKMEQLPANQQLAASYTNIGFIYSKTKDYQKALEYHFKSLEIRKKINYIRGIGQSYNNLGETYASLHEYDSALSNLLRALDIKQKNNEKAQVTLNNLGNVMLSLNNYHQAEEYFTRSLEIRREINDKPGETAVRNNLGLMELKRKNYSQAAIYLNESEKLAREIKSLDELRISLGAQVTLNEAIGNYPRALQYALDLISVKDSLLNKDKAESLQRMQLAYETDKMEQQIDLLQQQRETQNAELSTNKLWIRGLIVVGTLLIVISLLIANQYRLLKNNKKKVELLLSELNHRVKNNLQILSGLLRLQSEKLTDQNALDAIKTSEGRVNAMAIIHKKLSSLDVRQEINLKEYISELAEFLMSSYGYTSGNFNLSLQLANEKIDVDRAIPIGLILNEVMTNAFKYAFIDHSNPRLIIRLERVSNKSLFLEIADNGPGAERNNIDAKSFGLNLVDILSKELRAEYKLTIHNGTIVQFTIPVSR